MITPICFPDAGLQDDIRKVDETEIDLTNK